jgi:hypothetical protein
MPRSATKKALLASRWHEILLNAQQIRHYSKKPAAPNSRFILCFQYVVFTKLDRTAILTNSRMCINKALYSHCPVLLEILKEDDQMPLDEGDLLKVSNDEYLARLHARNRIVLSFATVSSALIGIALAEKTGGFAFVAIGVGYFSLASTLLSRHHEHMMWHLIAYQKQEIKPQCEAWPNFRSTQVEKVRHERDVAVFWMHFGFCLVALAIGILREFYDPVKAPASPPWLHTMKIVLASLRVVASIISLVDIAKTQKDRRELSHWPDI